MNFVVTRRMNNTRVLRVQRSKLTFESWRKSIGMEYLTRDAIVVRNLITAKRTRKDTLKKMAKIIFERSGGFFEPLIDLSLDLDTLPPQDAQRMLYLIEDADFFHLTENRFETPAVDKYIYTITVEANAARHSVRFSEMDLPESLQPLINELSTLVPAY